MYQFHILRLFAAASRRLKGQHFSGKITGCVPTKSPVAHMTDDQWGDLIKYWSDPKNVVRFVKTMIPDHILDSYYDSVSLVSFLEFGYKEPG
jgi:hypothetical protein